MFVRLKKIANKSTQVAVVENRRVGQKVQQRIIRSIGCSSDEKAILQLKAIGDAVVIEIKNARMPVLAFEDPALVHAPVVRSISCEDSVKVKHIKHESSFNDGLEKVFGGVYNSLHFNKALKTERKNQDWNALLRSLVIARLADPTSKRQSQRVMKDKLQEEHSLDTIYSLMDHLHANEKRVKSLVLSATKSLFRDKIDVLFFDVTTLYFESTNFDELKRFGYSKDCKFGEVQVVLALVTTTDGLPVSYKIFPGNTSEGKTLIECIKELKKDFEVNQVVLAADRAMFTEGNLAMLEAEGVHYVVAAKLKAMSKLQKEKILDSSNYGVMQLGDANIWVGEFDHCKRRLVVTASHSRAVKDAADRQRLIDRLVKKSADGKIPLSSLVTNQGTKRFVKIANTKAELDQTKIDEAAKWDGLHGVITNNKNAPIAEILACYKGLWQIEEAFRVNKHELRMRPIYHWTPKRIEAHVLLCFMAFAVSKHVTTRLKQRGKTFSLTELRYQLDKVEQHRVIDTSTKKRYLIPSSLSREQQSILTTLEIRRSTETVSDL